MTQDVQQILQALQTLRIGPQPEEYEIHAAIAQALSRAQIEYAHEYTLAPGRRIDFICGHIGIEVKKSRPAAAQLRAQLTRYLQEPMLESVIVVMPKPRSLPETICKKRVYVLALNRLWGVALG